MAFHHRHCIETFACPCTQPEETTDSISDPEAFKSALLEFMRKDTKLAKGETAADHDGMVLMDKFSVRGTGEELIDFYIPQSRETLCQSLYICKLCHFKGKQALAQHARHMQQTLHTHNMYMYRVSVDVPTRFESMYEKETRPFHCKWQQFTHNIGAIASTGSNLTG
jgi:hypothetical protein